MERESKPNPEILQPISSLSLRDRERKLERERKPKKPPNPLDQARRRRSSPQHKRDGIWEGWQNSSFNTPSLKQFFFKTTAILNHQWHNSLEEWWEKHKSVDTGEGFQVLMLRDEVERYDKLLNMGKMKLDCDISIEDSLRYATQFGIPFKERWSLGTNRPEVLYCFIFNFI
ncbi:hypothetical protein DVH24_041976 [Malus domestica]|uniref:Uncharacterized protein n=1 Tax=Malus domestica TaxID=3750 RepID=A0A498INU8_MALDO|nr:hypothetical protein DVH24_041976 [Malus domestica]